MVFRTDVCPISRTNEIRAIVILVVVVCHLLPLIINEIGQGSLGSILALMDSAGFGNAFVGLFFVVSGYGIYKSLARNTSKGGGVSLKYYLLRRISRTYPLYWIAYVTLYLEFDLSSFDLMKFLALDFTQPGFLWFIPALIQCYILAPVLYSALNRFGGSRFFILVVLFAGISNIAFIMNGKLSVNVWLYRGL